MSGNNTSASQCMGITVVASFISAPGVGCEAWEAEIDRAAAKIWGITDDELRAIQDALAEMSPGGTASPPDFGELSRTEDESEDA